jgi:CHAD domain-containing protein
MADEGAKLGEYAANELMRAARQLGRQGEERHDGVHQGRKSIRRARAALALLAPSLHAATPVRRLDGGLRSLCRGLSSLRDADALRDALLHLAKEAVIGPIECERLCALVSVLRARRLSAALQRDPDFARRRQRLAQAIERLQRLPWDTVGPEALKAAHAVSVARLQKALKRAAKSEDPEDWHLLRRRLRRLRQQESALNECAPDIGLHSEDIGALAEQMSTTQDHALLLAHCRRSGVFLARDRATLRRLVEPLYRASLDDVLARLKR